jgi:TetR/AcrR family transcriptional regulator, transcriptional repressor of bet genes
MPGERAPEEKRREQILRAAYEVALRAGLDGVTVRAVAAEARLSHGLVLFHFGTKDQLVAALLDRVLATSALLGGSDGLERFTHTADGLRTFLRGQIEELARRPHDVRLFFEYWALGTREPSIRAKIGEALDRYREALRTLLAETIGDAPMRASDVTPDAFAAVAVSLLSGFAVQSVADPEAFDMGAYAATVKRLLEQLVAPSASPPPIRS